MYYVLCSMCIFSCFFFQICMYCVCIWLIWTFGMKVRFSQACRTSAIQCIQWDTTCFLQDCERDQSKAALCQHTVNKSKVTAAGDSSSFGYQWNAHTPSLGSSLDSAQALKLWIFFSDPDKKISMVSCIIDLTPLSFWIFVPTPWPDSPELFLQPGKMTFSPLFANNPLLGWQC